MLARTPPILLFLAFRVKREITDGRTAESERRRRAATEKEERAEELTRITKTPKRQQTPSSGEERGVRDTREEKRSIY